MGAIQYMAMFRMVCQITACSASRYQPLLLYDLSSRFKPPGKRRFMITRCGSKEIHILAIDPGRSARLCSGLVISVTTLTVLGQSYHKFVCCSLSSDIGALSAAYVDMAISTAKHCCLPRPDSGFAGPARMRLWLHLMWPIAHVL